MTVTIRHKKAAKNLRNSTSRQSAMIEANYSPSYAQTSQIKHTKGWKELMEKHLPDNLLLRVHKEGLKATKQQGVGGLAIGLNGDITGHDKFVPDYAIRHRYLDAAYKIKGKVTEKHAHIVGIAALLSDDD